MATSCGFDSRHRHQLVASDIALATSFSFQNKTHRALILLLLAPKPQPLCRFAVLSVIQKNIGFNRPFQGNARRRQAAWCPHSSESILLRYSTSEQTHFLFPFFDPRPPRLAIDAIPPGLHLRKYAVFCISVFSHALIFSALCYNG